MPEFKYEPPLEDVLKRIVGGKVYAEARDFLIDAKQKECKAGNHAWKRVAYDLQGGKWGKERCIRCGEEKSWRV